MDRHGAVGAFERPDPDGSEPRAPCAGDRCVGRRVQLWRVGDSIAVRGAFERLGACRVPDDPDELETSTVLFVPEERLTSALAARATRLGVDLGRCTYETMPGSPRPPPPPGAEALLAAAARPVVPKEIGDLAVERALRAALWRPDGKAVAVSFPRYGRSMLYVFVRHANGRFVAAATTPVEAKNLSMLGLAPGEFDEARTAPVRWLERGDGRLQILVRTSAWRSGRRFAVTEPLLLEPDGTVRWR